MFGSPEISGSGLPGICVHGTMRAFQMSVHEAIGEWEPELIATRRELHMHPELGLEGFRTSGIVVERLRLLGITEIQTGIAVTGAKAIIKGERSGKVFLLRGDMDALPIEEESAVEYRSQTSGTMHACGHDGHTAMLLAPARVLMSRRDEIAGTIVLCFQPAEEGRGGAKRMVGSGRGVGESTGRRRDGAPRDMGYEGVSGRKRTRTSLATSRPRGVRRRRTPSSCTTPSGASAANCGP